MSNFFKSLFKIILLVPPLVLFINWRVDTAVKKAVEESKITMPIAVDELYAVKCALCHGGNGDGRGAFPRINNYPKDELAEKLKTHKSASNSDPIIKIEAGTLSGAEIDALSRFITTMRPAEPQSSTQPAKTVK